MGTQACLRPLLREEAIAFHMATYTYALMSCYVVLSEGICSLPRNLAGDVGANSA